MFDMEVFSKTDIGLVRTENQDSSAYSVISSDCAWAVVCDGMGGVHGGKTASSTAVNYIYEYIGEQNLDRSKIGHVPIENGKPITTCNGTISTPTTARSLGHQGLRPRGERHRFS